MGFQSWDEEPAGHQIFQDLKNNQIAHAYLFTGPPSEQKLEAAHFLAGALLCSAPEAGRPCGVCSSCLAWIKNAHPDYYYIETEGNNVKIEQIRSWSSYFNYRPQLGKHQVFFLQAPELLTAPAANSLLKILEEPLPQTVFILVTDNERTLLPTIVSRCRVLGFHRRPGAMPAQDCIDSQNGALIYRLLWEAKESELLRAVRLLKQDRMVAQDLLRFLQNKLEHLYHRQREQALKGTDEQKTNLAVLECLEFILQGLRSLENNVYVPLLLALTLRSVQKRLRELQRDDAFREVRLENG